VLPLLVSILGTLRAENLLGTGQFGVVVYSGDSHKKEVVMFLDRSDAAATADSWLVLFDISVTSHDKHRSNTAAVVSVSGGWLVLTNVNCTRQGQSLMDHLQMYPVVFMVLYSPSKPRHLLSFKRVNEVKTFVLTC